MMTDDAAAPAQGGASKRTRLKAPPLVVIALYVALPCIIVDQVSKLVVLHHFQAHTAYPLIGDFISIEVVRNPGAAFSFASGFTWVFSIIALAVLVWIGWMGRNATNRPWQIALGLVAGGATGNLIDRLVRPPSFGAGHVIDFINYYGFFVGNIADIIIVVGVAAIVVLVMMGIPQHCERRNTQSGGERP